MRREKDHESKSRMVCNWGQLLGEHVSADLGSRTLTGSSMVTVERDSTRADFAGVDSCGAGRLGIEIAIQHDKKPSLVLARNVHDIVFRITIRWSA